MAIKINFSALLRVSLSAPTFQPFFNFIEPRRQALVQNSGAAMTRWSILPLGGPEGRKRDAECWREAKKSGACPALNISCTARKHYMRIVHSVHSHLYRVPCTPYSSHVAWASKILHLIICRLSALHFIESVHIIQYALPVLWLSLCMYWYTRKQLFC